MSTRMRAYRYGRVMVLALAVVGGCAPCDPSWEMSLTRANECKHATEILGSDIHKAFGMSSGQSEVNASGFGHSGWSVPVAGSKSSGQLEYNAERHAGSWEILRAWINVEDQQIPIVPCRSPIPHPE